VEFQWVSKKLVWFQYSALFSTVAIGYTESQKEHAEGLFTLWTLFRHHSAVTKLGGV